MFINQMFEVFKKHFDGFHPSIPTKKADIESTSEKFATSFINFSNEINRFFIDNEREAIDRAVRHNSDFYKVCLKREKEETEFYEMLTWIFTTTSTLLYVVMLFLLTA
jgi:hypothetical protein